MKKVVELVAKAGNFRAFIVAVKAAGLAETLDAPGPFTVFAPTDAAFAALPRGAMDALLGDREKLSSIVTYHVMPGRFPSTDVAQASGIRTTLNGQPLDVVVRGGTVRVNGAQIVTPDVVASNGVIHVIDAVLIPSRVPAGATR
jgi:uncharacterized surface protein with fasciclin (FAS1) repeats